MPALDRQTVNRRYYLRHRDKLLVAAKKRRELRASSPQYFVSQLLDRAKVRSAKRQIPFDLTTAHVLDKLRDLNYCCQVTQVPFHFGTDPYNPWQLSIDRIDSSLGYTTDNVQYVALIYNVAKNEWGHEAVLCMANSLVNIFKLS